MKLCALSCLCLHLSVHSGGMLGGNYRLMEFCVESTIKNVILFKNMEDAWTTCSLKIIHFMYWNHTIIAWSKEPNVKFSSTVQRLLLSEISWRLVVRDSSAVGRQSALHKENSEFPAPTLGRHISTFRGYQILFSIRNPYINRFTNHFSIHSQPSYSQKVVLTLDYSTILP